MNRGIGNAVVTVQIRTVPFGRVRSCTISTLQKIQHSLGRIGRLANLIVVKQELTKIIVKLASTCQNCRMEVLRNWGGITVKGRLPVTTVAGPEAGADA